MTREITLGLFVALFLAADCLATETPVLRPTTGGISLAYPKQQWLTIPRNLIDRWDHDIRVPLNLQIDTNGVVTGVRSVIEKDSLLRGALDSAFRTLSFVPGALRGVPTRQEITVDCVMWPGARGARLISPVTDSLLVPDAARYAQALSDNGLAIPTVARLAPYFCTLTAQDSVTNLPSILMKVSISKGGNPHAIEIVRSGLPSMSDQMIALVNWGKFRVSPSDAKAPATDFFLAFVFHPAARYPTRRIGDTGNDSASLVESFLSQIFPDTVGLMLPPLPRRLQYDSVAVTEAINRPFGRVSVWLGVDNTGKTQIERSSRLESPVFNLVTRVVEEMLLYPALGFDGQPRNFSGLVYIDFDGSATVRVRLDWLHSRTGDSVQ
jgi:hypothetical protein